MSREDQRKVEEGLAVPLRRRDEGAWYKHIVGLTREDRPARIEAERGRIEWIRKRQLKRSPPHRFA